MSGRPAILKVDIISDAKGVGPGVSQAEGRLSKFGRTAGKVGKFAAIGLGGAAVAAVGVAGSLIKAAESGRIADNRVRQVNKSMDLFGKNTDKVSNRLLNYADKQARVVGVDDEIIKTTQAKLLTFGELGKTADKLGGHFDRATDAALDMAAAGFGTAEGNAVQLGKALNDPIKGVTALAKSGVTFTEVEKARIATLVESNRMGQAQEMVLAAIEKQVGGTAAATATSSDKMKVAFDQVTGVIGDKLLVAYDALTKFVLDKVMPAAGRLANYLSRNLGPAFRTVGNFISRNVVPVLQGLARFVLDKVVPAFKSYATPAIDGIRSAFRSFGDAIERNRPQLEALLGGLAKVAGFILKRLAPVLGLVIGTGFKVLGKVLGGVIDVIGGFVEGVEAIVDALQKVYDMASKVTGVIGKVGGALGKVGGLVGLSVVDLAGPSPSLTGGSPGLAPGGIGLSTSSLAPTFGTWTRTPGLNGTPVITVDRRDQRTTIKIDGAYDPVAVGRQLERVLDDHRVRLGRQAAWSGGR